MANSIDKKAEEDKIIQGKTKRQYEFGKNPRRDNRVIRRGVNNIVWTNRYLRRLMNSGYTRGKI